MRQRWLVGILLVVGLIASCGGGGGGGGQNNETCGNGVDDDDDGLVDCDDIDCEGFAACTPEADCTDSEDNDEDGLYDCDDPDCAGDPACGGTPDEICDDAIDNDGDLLADCLDPDCGGDPACPLSENCTDATDNDGDTYVDCEDDFCFASSTCYDVDDPIDLPGPNGDPSVDLDKVGATLTNGTGTVFATTEGVWPPPVGTYSWFVELNFDASSGAPVAGVTVQHHAGVASTLPLGVPAGNITVRQSPIGIFVRVTGVAATATQFSVKAGIQKTAPGTRVVDAVPSQTHVFRIQKSEYGVELTFLGIRIAYLAVPATANLDLATTSGAYGYRVEVPPGGTIRVCVTASMAASVNYFPQYSPGFTFVDGAPGCTDITNLDPNNTNWVLVKVAGSGSPNNITVTTSAQ